MRIWLQAHGITRDSIIWTLGVVASYTTFLSQCPAPGFWTWMDWMKFTAFTSVWLCGQLGNSALLGKKAE